MSNTIVNPNYKPYTRSTKDNYAMAYRLLRIIKKNSTDADSERRSYSEYPDSIKDNAMESMKNK
jgi:hypothetical protein